MDYVNGSSDYLSANPGWHVEDSPWKASQIIKMLKRKSLHPRSIVEIGCGAGEILNQLYERWDDKAVKLWGYDISADAYAFCKQREKDRLKFVHGDLLKTGERFDVLLMIDVFEHVEDYFDFIRKSARHAEYKIFHIPLDLSALAAMTGHLMKLRHSVGHIHHFSREMALNTLKDCGLEVVDWFYTLSELELNYGRHNFNGKVVNSFRRALYTVNPELAVKTVGGFSLLVLAK
ncbi:Methyltransferase domain-containing protein [Dyadobacter soli]|uniref:Methyltransferase domain-containing protein n=1 Tax=Dyadobacter soli TaxID=659014 RepID=A0A1G7K5G6_9BACT|nr:class I SAM-dependent methyltransferase [Dyadobacter soli]SDF32214.1 Methyltransferase domain-containing protein [Dyadobacter soli]